LSVEPDTARSLHKGSSLSPIAPPPPRWGQNNAYAGEAKLPPVHLASGRGTSLGDLARLAIDAADGRSRLIEAAPLGYNVSRFVGDPSRARRLLGWEAGITIAAGVRNLVSAFRLEIQQRSTDEPPGAAAMPS
jgi:hypothetical protein